MSSHLIHLTPDEGGMVGWRLECTHPDGEFASCEEDGTPLEPYECYLVSWFDNVGAELLAKSDWPTFTMAVEVAPRSHYWGEPELVTDKSDRATDKSDRS